MEDQSETMFAYGVGEPLGKIVVAFLEIVHAITSQPGFDRSAFDRRIQERIASSEVDSFTKSILKHVLDEESGGGEITTPQSASDRK